MLSIPFLTACAADIDQYTDVKPALDMSTFFNGHLQAYGIVQDYKGTVKRRFSADILGHWSDNNGLLDEQFIFDDGEQQHRCWRLTKSGQQYTGTAGDVIGEAQGKVSGNTLNWKYTLSVPIDGSQWKINFDDWMYLVDENNLINRAKMRKFGLEVGQVTLYIHKVSTQAHRPLTEHCKL